MQLIDVDVLIGEDLFGKRGCTGNCSICNLHTDNGCRVIFEAPIVDAVPVVRCKDCKHHEDEEPGMVYCPLQIGGWRSENWFCAAGEKKDGECYECKEM